MTSPLPEPQVIPAQLSFLTIYNPSFGPTDETFPDQILFYHSRAAREAKSASKNGGGPDISKNELREQENERLRQVGLAQGMVDFAKTFANGQPVDSVETEKARIVLQQLEEGWWLLASIDLTRLPKAKTLSAGASASKPDDQYDYSSREVSPPALLNQQILTAHRIFLLHHGPSLSEIYDKVGREKLCDALDRFWARFCRYWEVLLHGNPAIDALGGLKLSSGGELGIGVGEEEWGSGERAVLEDLVHNTEGLVDLIVSRFGEAKDPKTASDSGDSDRDPPWIGRGRPADAEDGVVFGGTGQLSRTSLRDVSSWIQQIYTYGDYAYGVKDNPARKRRRQTRRPPAKATRSRSGSPPPEVNPSTTQQDKAAPTAVDGEALDKVPSIPTLPPDPRPALHDRVASHDHAPGSPSVTQDLESDNRPSIPPPIVKAAERALSQATSKAQEVKKPDAEPSESQSSPFAISDRWMKYLTLGLSTVGKPAQEDASTRSTSKGARPTAATRKSTASSRTLQPPADRNVGRASDESGRTSLQQLEPMPEGHLVESQVAEQKRLERDGYFLIGYRGQLEEEEVNAIDEDEAGERLLLRTLHVEVVRKLRFGVDSEVSSDADSVSTYRNGMTTEKYERLRVLVYVRRPFIYAFLFEQRAPALQMGAFYLTLHKHLRPLQASMSNSTSAENVNKRVEGSREEAIVPDSPGSTTANKAAQNQPIFDLMFDPVRLTVHSSIPNIPLPGTPAAEGFSLSFLNRDPQVASWTRIEALNVHSQILNTLESTKNATREIERSAKTNRGWWVVWMRLPPSKTSITSGTLASSSTELSQSSTLQNIQHTQDYETDQCRIAILVRKSSDWMPPKASTGSRLASGMFGLGRSEDVTGGVSAGWGPATLAGGMGFDARRYVEGLLSLNR